MSQCDVTRQKSAQKRPKQRLSGGCAMGAYLMLNATYLVSTATYCCKLSFNVHFFSRGKFMVTSLWQLHKEQFLCASLIVIDIYPMVFVNLLQLLYTNRIYWRTYVIYHTKIVLDRKLVCIVNIYTICLLLYHICSAV